MKGILFKPDMIKAIVEDEKTRTRRVIKPQPPPRFIDKKPDLRCGILSFVGDHYSDYFEARPRYNFEDVIYIKEAWCVECYGIVSPQLACVKDADNEDCDYAYWRSPMFMPERAARYFIRITDERAERLRDITEEEIRREGCPQVPASVGLRLQWFKDLWNSINKPPYDWSGNPWCFVYTFRQYYPHTKRAQC